MIKKHIFMDVSDKAKKFILRVGKTSSKRWRQTKKEYEARLEKENKNLNDLIIELHNEINRISAQNEVIKTQLEYFHECFEQGVNNQK